MLNNPNYNHVYWDMKYYYNIHVQRQKMLWNIPLTYDGFIKRVKKMNLHDAIYAQRTRPVRRWKSPTPIQDEIRRAEKLKEENVMVVDFKELKKLEQPLHPKKTKPMANYNMKPKKSLLQRFISLFK